MTERIDWANNARERISIALRDTDTKNALVTAQVAAAEATLALVEQQRIANLLKADEVSLRAQGYELSADIREALGL